ncbi:hypothetical protein [Pseudorhodobacter antarcticus]|nr:hypothetical protein [Pseudorhodobacter antarcticus]
MTNQLAIAPDLLAPPIAPLAMPKQTLTPDAGAPTLLARAALLMLSFRRIG